MSEIWKVTTVNSDYEVSNLGRVRSNKFNKTKILKPFKLGSKNFSKTNKSYYISVRFLKNGSSKDYAVHRLVATAFVPNPNNYQQVNHINGVRNDNRAENLEWCNHSYNVWHSYNVLGNVSGVSIPIYQYSKNGEFIKEWTSAAAASKETGIDSSSISAVCKKIGYRKMAGGYIWRYKEDCNVNVEYTKTKPVVQISKYGEYLQTFDSIANASICTGISECSIAGVCAKRERGYNYAGGFIWRYKNEYNEKEFNNYLNKTFIQMTYNNIFVAEYKGVPEALHFLVYFAKYKTVDYKKLYQYLCTPFEGS